MNGKVVGLVLLVAGGLMQAIITAGAWIANGSSQPYDPPIPTWHQNWLGILFVIIGAVILMGCFWGPRVAQNLKEPFVPESDVEEARRVNRD